jgi:hypothetical protein
VAQFHKDHADGTIQTSYDFKEGYVIFKAEISFDRKFTNQNMPKDLQETSVRIFTGHAFGKVGVEKAFEKLESVAVGRALAFAGYLAGGEIASYDEIEKFNGNS